jgi:hypothetical protein
VRILKTEVPIDDEWHAVRVGSGVVHVGHQHEGCVTIWYREQDPNVQRITTYRVYGTGHDIKALAGEGLLGIYPTHVATVQSPSGLVWHLVQR